MLACFVLSTWLIERLPVAPYIALVGLPRSGKSTTLSLLNLLCRRSLLTADITSAAFYRVCDRLTPTLLIDETGTAGERRILFHLLRTGTTREPVALRRDESFKAFGPKVISWIELPDDAALNSRCIEIPLQETHRTDLIRPANPEILHAAEDLQRQFLQFRFEKFNAFKLPKVQGDHRLHSRARDLFEALALPIGEDTENCEILLSHFEAQQESNREPLPPCQAAVLQTLFIAIHMCPGVGTYAVRYLTQVVNGFLKEAKERYRVSPRRVGGALTSLGLIERRRTNTGWEVLLDRKTQKQIHGLMTAYGVDNFLDKLSVWDIERCEFCKEIKRFDAKERFGSVISS